LDGLGNITVRTVFFLSSVTLTVQRRKSGTQFENAESIYYAICKLHGSEMCGREINKLATDLISKILISRGQVKIKSRHEPPPRRPK
jgi:hypothetical protein